LKNIVTLKSGLEVTHGNSTGIVRKVGCGFLFVFHSNYGSINQSINQYINQSVSRSINGICKALLTKLDSGAGQK